MPAPAITCNLNPLPMPNHDLARWQDEAEARREALWAELLKRTAQRTPEEVQARDMGEC